MLDSFLDKYEVINSTSEYRRLFSRQPDKRCKFCGLTSKETTFTAIPHVLPELFGKNNYTSNEECDKCNTHFGQYETDLSNFISPYLSLLSQKTKSKIPVFQGRKERTGDSTTIRNVNGEPKIYFGNNLEDFHYDYNKRLLHLRFKKKKFNPLNVYKAFVHIALTLCPTEELVLFKDTVDWVLDTDTADHRPLDIPMVLFRTKFTNKKYATPSAALFRRKIEVNKEAYLPRLSLVVNSGILVFQLFIIGCSETAKFEKGSYKLSLDIYPAFIFDLNLPGNFESMTVNIDSLPIKQYDMNHNEKVTEDEMFSLKYSSLLRK
jgi:hypothetical protein